MFTTQSMRRVTSTGLLISGPLVLASLALFAILAVTNASASTEGPTGEGSGGLVLAVEDDAETVDVVPVSDEASLGSALPTITYEVVISRDPFDPVRPEPEPDPDAPTDPADPVVPTDPADPADPARPPRPIDPDDPDAPRPIDPPITTLPVTVLEVGEDSVRVQVGDRIYDVNVGEIFADRYVLDAIVGGCARITDQLTDRTQVVCVDESGFK